MLATDLNYTCKQGSILWQQAQDSTAIASTTTETIFDQQFTFPAGSLEAGDLITAEWIGTAGITATPTSLYTLRWGGVAGTSLAALTALAVTTTGFIVQARIYVRSTTSFIVMLQAFHAAAQTQNCPAAVTVATTAATALTLTQTWSANSASNTTKTTGAYVSVGRFGI